MTITAILAGPHLKSLVDDGGSTLIVIEPLAFVPIRHRAPPAHPAAPVSPTGAATPSQVSA